MASGEFLNQEPVIVFWSHLQHFLEARRNAARNAGLDNTGYELLLALKTFPKDVDPNVSAMGRRLMLRYRVAAKTVKQLARQGLVHTQRGRHDHRCLALRLTPKGERLLSKLASESIAGLAGDAPPLLESLRHLRLSGRPRGGRHALHASV
jgi:DNA-binding MarR family transcriptional regulator